MAIVSLVTHDIPLQNSVVSLVIFGFAKYSF